MPRVSPVRLLALALLALSLTAGTGAGASQDARRGAAALAPWTSDDVLAMRTVTDPQVSPDGQWVAYVVNCLNAEKDAYQTDIWLVAVGGGPARRLTTSSVVDEEPRWSSDGRTLAFLSERPRPDGPTGDAARDDEGKRQLWMIRPDGGEAWLATSAPGGVSEFAWSADGRSIAYLSREPKSDARRKREKEKDDAATPKDRYRWNRLWVMDVASSRARQLGSPELHVTGFSFSPDGRQLAIAAQPTPLLPDQYASDLYVVAAAGGPPRPLVQRRGLDATPTWSPDGRWIAFVSQDGRSEEWFVNNYLCVIPAAGGPIRNLTRDLDERVDGLAGRTLEWLGDSRGLVFQALQGTSQNLFRVDLEGHIEPLTRGAAMSSAGSIDRAGHTMAFLRETGETPRDVWTMRLPDGAPQRLTDANPETRSRVAYRKELVRWKGADGWDIEGLLILPAAGRSGQRVPLLLNVHGGPAGTHSNSFCAASKIYPWPLFAQQGWAILMPNPRGSGGYGESFRASNRRDWGGKDYEDLMLGVDAMIERGIADPARLAISGWSYGGYMTATVVTRTHRFRAALLGAGVTNLSSMAGTCDIPEFNRSYFDAWPWEDAQVYVDHSALFHAGQVTTPTLLLHGEADERVPVSQGWEFYTALKKVGVPTDLLLLPRQPHGPREPKLLRSAEEWQLEWLAKYALSPAARRPNGAPRAAPESNASVP